VDPGEIESALQAGEPGDPVLQEGLAVGIRQWRRIDVKKDASEHRRRACRHTKPCLCTEYVSLYFVHLSLYR
jgi:hypothetical protein